MFVKLILPSRSQYVFVKSPNLLDPYGVAPGPPPAGSGVYLRVPFKTKCPRNLTRDLEKVNGREKKDARSFARPFIFVKSRKIKKYVLPNEEDVKKWYGTIEPQNDGWSLILDDESQFFSKKSCNVFCWTDGDVWNRQHVTPLVTPLVTNPVAKKRKRHRQLVSNPVVKKRKRNLLAEFHGYPGSDIPEDGTGIDMKIVANVTLPQVIQMARREPLCEGIRRRRTHSRIYYQKIKTSSKKKKGFVYNQSTTMGYLKHGLSLDDMVAVSTEQAKAVFLYVRSSIVQEYNKFQRQTEVGSVLRRSNRLQEMQK